MLVNQPEKPHFDRIMRVEGEIAERKEDLKALWESAKGALEKDRLKVLKEAVRRAKSDRDKLEAKRSLEDAADDLIKALGAFADSELGEAALRAAG